MFVQVKAKYENFIKTLITYFRSFLLWEHFF